MPRNQVFFLLLLSCVAAAPRARAGEPRHVASLEKKLIEYGWDVPTPDFIRANLRQMEKRPFDGLIFKLKGGRNVMEPKAWEESRFAADYDNLTGMPWQRFTDNFVIMHAASDQDWFNDRHWEAIEHNVRLVSKAARLAKCVGVCFDAEPYGRNPWHYPKVAHRETKSFAEYERMIRRRGAQFVNAIQSELPKTTVLTFFHVSFLPQALHPMAPEKRKEILARHGYGLYPAFLNGMLDASGDGMEIVDGNELAYYYNNSRQYLAAYHRIAQEARYLIDPTLWGRYRATGRVGQALYLDYYFGLGTRKVLGHYLEPAEQAKWLEHNAYWALTTSDKYVWCYSERMNWWKDQNIPPGCEEALHAARQKVAEGKPLGFDPRPIFEAGRKRQTAAAKTKK